MVRAYLGLGANLGDPLVAFAKAIRRLEAIDGVTVTRVAPNYHTAPVGPVDQPPFLNSAVEIETSLGPEELLRNLKTIESEMGRTPTVRWGPRLIDIDLLLYGDEQVDSPRLKVPHTEMWRRAFVLAPLSDLRPDLVSPDGRPIADVLDELARDQQVRQHSSPTVPSQS